MLSILYAVAASALWLIANAALCFAIETTYVGYFGLIRWVSIAAVVVFAAIASISEWHAGVFWMLAALGAVGFACATLHPLLRLEGAFGTFLPPARQWLTQHDRELFAANLGSGTLGGLFAVVVVLAMAAVVVGFLRSYLRKNMRINRTELKVDLATFGPHRHQRLCELAVGNDRSLASEALARLDPVRDRGVFKEALRKWPDIPRMSFLRTLPYPEEAKFLREQLAHYDQYEHYDLAHGWPHDHRFVEVSRTEPDPNQKVVDEACTCGLHRITRKTLTLAERCPKCGQELRLVWNGMIYKYWDEPPKPWYGYDAYCDPDMYTSGFVCSHCGYSPEDPNYSPLSHEEETTTYEWRSI